MKDLDDREWWLGKSDIIAAVISYVDFSSEERATTLTP